MSKDSTVMVENQTNDPLDSPQWNKWMLSAWFCRLWWAISHIFPNFTFSISLPSKILTVPFKHDMQVIVGVISVLLAHVQCCTTHIIPYLFSWIRWIYDCVSVYTLLCIHWVTVYTAGTPTQLAATPLRVAEVTQNSVRLNWNPLRGATGYILRWRDVKGKTSW